MINRVCKNCGCKDFLYKNDKYYCEACGTEDDNVLASVVDSTVHYFNDDKPSTILNIISFFFSIVGLVLWLSLKQSQPNKAKSCAKFSLISIGIEILLFVIIPYIGSIVSA